MTEIVKVDPTKSKYWGMKGVKFPPPGSPELEYTPIPPEELDRYGLTQNSRCLNCGCPRRSHPNDGPCVRVSYTTGHGRRNKCPCMSFDHPSLPIKPTT